MDIRRYEELKETVFMEKLNNGLDVKLIPKRDYSKTYMILFTDFGSVDTTFIPRGENTWTTYPAGIAHFLEHKLFETEDGDVSHVFSSQGASVNAYTSNTKTAFMCSCTINLRKNLETLLDFVQSPFFTSCSVEDEKSIITQEIQMYEDDPDWNLTRGLIENLYPDHPVRIDVAGTEESVREVSVAMLQSNYDTFYNPENLHLVVIGNIDPYETLEWIVENQELKKLSNPGEIKRLTAPEPQADIIKYRETRSPVNLPKVLVGIRGSSYTLNEQAAFRHIAVMEIILDLLFGETSSTYLSLYNDNLIDDSFSYDYIFERGFDYVSIGGDSRTPELLSENIIHVLINHQFSSDLSSDHFQLVKKKMIGQYIQDLNSLEYVAHQFVDFPFKEMTLFDYPDVLNSVTFEDIQAVAHDYFRKEAMSVFIVKKSEDEK